MKLFYLIRKLYSRYLIREAVIILLTAYLIYALATALSPISYTLSLQNSVKESVRSESIYFLPFERVQSLLDGRLYASEEEVDEMSDLMKRSLGTIDGLIGQGKTAELIFSNDSHDNIRMIGYDDAMRKNCSLPLKDGEWFQPADAQQPSDSIPVVLGGRYRDLYSVGDCFELNIDMTGKTMKCYVIGLLDDRDIFFNLGYGSTMPRLNSIAVMNKWVNMGVPGADQFIMLAPLEKLNFVTPSDVSKSRLLFFEEGTNVQKTASVLQEGGKYGNYYTVDTLFHNELEITFKIYNTEFVLALVLFLFGVFGLGGYTLLSHSRNENVFGVYFLCGMKKRTAVFISVLAASLLVAIPAVVMTLLSPLYIPAMSESGIITYWVTIGSVSIIIIISALISAQRIAKMNLSQIDKGE